MNIQELEASVKSLDAQIDTLETERQRLKSRLLDAKSKEAVTSLGIRKADVTYDNGANMPWFGDVWSFAKWLKNNPKEIRLYATWNGQIHFTHMLLADKFQPTDARWEDVK